MTNGNKGNLFLLELIVDYVQYDYSQNEREFIDSETCVTFNFLNNGPVYIREWEFNKCSSCSENDYIKFGKCCLFSLDPTKMAKTYADFNLPIVVYKIMYADNNPQMVHAGKASVPLAQLYKQLMEHSGSGNTSGKNMQGNFVLTNTTGNIIGQISLFVRLSSFGKTLISTVKMNVGGDAENLKYVTQKPPTPNHCFGEFCTFQQNDQKFV